jgi:hypothetical protein
VDGYEAASRRGEIVVSVGAEGVSIGVRLSPAAMELAADELAARVVRLTTLAYLRCQLDLAQRPARGGDADHGVRLSTTQVAAYARTIDF